MNVQRGDTLVYGSLGYVDVTIAAVDPATTLVIAHSRAVDGSGVARPDYGASTAHLVNATTLRLWRSSTDTRVAHASHVFWEVVELGGASVQAKEVSLLAATASVNVAITAVDLAKSFVTLAGYRTPYTATSTSSQFVNDTVTATLTSATNLSLTRHSAPGDVHVVAHVVEVK